MIYCENIVNVTLFFLLSLDFGTTFFPPIFGNAIATIVTIFFPYFGNGIVTISLLIFFFSFHFGHSTHTSYIQATKLDRGISVSTLSKFNIFSLHFFFFFSLILLVEFRLWQYRNSISLFRIPNKFQSFL